MPLLQWVGRQLQLDPTCWSQYAKRDETRREHLLELQALAELVNAQFRHPFAEHWGDGATSSPDGQNFRTGNKAESTGHINPKYGSSPGRTFYTHISDQYAPFHTEVVLLACEIRDRNFEQQRHRASGLNLVTAAIILWNTVYLERAVNALQCPT